jgi:hypothetical protein
LTVLTATVATLIAIAFMLFGVRAVMIMRDRPRDASEFLRRWFGR